MTLIYSPGPWKWDGEGDELGWTLRSFEDEELVVNDCNVYPPHGGNALLIEAAPELYEALDHVTDRLIWYLDNWPDGQPHKDQAQENASALLLRLQNDPRKVQDPDDD